MNAIEARGLGKHYRLYQRPADALKEWLLRRPLHQRLEVLNGVDFTLEEGDSLGVIGENGAGKSTLLKLLAGTLSPSAGSLRVNGRVSAILELGSGFHPEFNGIENARMGCALLGLGSAEIERALPEILAFSELGDAIQRPVKTYSSGMYVRLAFSLVTAVDPDILVIDEALSVGDIYFQKKSLDRIRSFIDQGRAVVFCSHNLYQVKSLCRRALWLEQGRVRLLGEASEVVDSYMDAMRERSTSGEAGEPVTMAANAVGAAFERVDLAPEGKHDYATGEPLVLRMHIDPGLARPDELHVGVVIMRNDNIHVYGVSTLIDGLALRASTDGLVRLDYRIEALPLLSGLYSFYLYLLDDSGLHVMDKRENVLPFRVRHIGDEVGVARIGHAWRVDDETR